MRIDSANIGMDSARTYASSESRSSRYAAKTYRESMMGGSLFGGLLNAGTESSGEELNANGNRTAARNLSDTTGAMRSRITELQNGSIRIYRDDPFEQLRILREECINYLFRLLFPDQTVNFQNGLFGGYDNGSSSQATSFSYRQEYYYEEYEETSFQTTGTVRTADGREIDFNLNLQMSRSFQEYYAEEIEQMDVALCDPLVINLEGTIPELSDQTFYFDIDGDGVEDEISKLLAGSGFLALDRNGDGTINDGSELFGTSSGDGFADLRIYDEDGNGFIDEGDSVFDKLKIWAMDENGEMQLYSLKEKNVGAIGLNRASTQFSLNSLADNTTNGVIRSTGIFLYENGEVGTVQQVDFARHSNRAVSEKLAAYA